MRLEEITESNKFIDWMHRSKWQNIERNTLEKEILIILKNVMRSDQKKNGTIEMISNCVANNFYSSDYKNSAKKNSNNSKWLFPYLRTILTME